jgi:hypothetical protein
MNLKHDMNILIKWFSQNSMKANPDKFQFMLLGREIDSNLVLKIDSVELKPSTDVILLGVILDNKLNFEKHIKNICRTSHYKLHALRRIRRDISLEKAKLLYNAFIHSLFNYAPLIWMFCKKKNYNLIERIHLKCLRIVYQSGSCYREILLENNVKSIHQIHLRFLATEIYKSLNDLSPVFMKEFFEIKTTSYNLRKGQILKLPSINSTFCGLNGLHFRSAILWNNIPGPIKASRSLFQFKQNIKELNIICSCVICR